MTIFFADNAFIVIFVQFKAIAAADRPTPLERDSTRPNDTNSRRDKEPVRPGHGPWRQGCHNLYENRTTHPQKTSYGRTVAARRSGRGTDAHRRHIQHAQRQRGRCRNGNGWQRRCPVICEQVEWIDFDIFGAQEIKKNQLDDLLAALPEYDYVGVGRDDGIHGGEHEPIFYKRDRFRLLDAGDFWISQTPDVAGSKGWDAALPRVCSYARLQDRETKLRFWYFNLHMDHIGVEARREGAKLIVQKVREMCGGEPVIITGDFNVDQNNEIYQTFVTSGLLKDSYGCGRETLRPQRYLQQLQARPPHREPYRPHIRLTGICRAQLRRADRRILDAARGCRSAEGRGRAAGDKPSQLRAPLSVGPLPRGGTHRGGEETLKRRLDGPEIRCRTHLEKTHTAKRN